MIKIYRDNKGGDKMNIVEIWKRARLENNNDLYMVVDKDKIMIKEIETEKIIKIIKTSNK